MRNKTCKTTENTGQTLIEVAVALSVMLIALAAISMAVITSLNNSQFIKNQSIAKQYAQQGMEAIGNLRNNNIVSFNSYNGLGCMDQNNVISPTTGNCGGVNIGGSFIRQVQFTKGASDCSSGTLVSVTVFWSSSKCDPSTPASRFCHKSQLVSCFREQNSATSP